MKNYKINDWEELSIKKSVRNIEKLLANNQVSDTFSYVSIVIALISIIFTFDFQKKLDIIITIIICVLITIIIFLLFLKLCLKKWKSGKKIRMYSNFDSIECFDNNILNNTMMANSLLYSSANSNEEDLQIISQVSYYINKAIKELNYISKYPIYSSNLASASHNNNIAIQRVEIVILNIKNIQKTLDDRIKNLEKVCSGEYMEILNDIKNNNEKFKKLGDKNGFEICILNNINYYLRK